MDQVCVRVCAHMRVSYMPVVRRSTEYVWKKIKDVGDVIPSRFQSEGV